MLENYVIHKKTQLQKHKITEKQYIS